MDIMKIVELISSVGFPIVCVIFLWRNLTTELKELTTAVQELKSTIDRLITTEDYQTSQLDKVLLMSENSEVSNGR